MIGRLPFLIALLISAIGLQPLAHAQLSTIKDGDTNILVFGAVDQPFDVFRFVVGGSNVLDMHAGSLWTPLRISPLGSSSTNIAGHAGLTNATRLPIFRWRDVFTNKFVTLQAGANLTLTDEGTNIVISSTGTNGLATISYVTNFYRAGSVGLTKLELTKAISFSSALADTNYALSLTASTNTVMWYSNKTVNGFTLRVTVGLTGRVDYLAWPLR